MNFSGFAVAVTSPHVVPRGGASVLSTCPAGVLTSRLVPIPARVTMTWNGG